MGLLQVLQQGEPVNIEDETNDAPTEPLPVGSEHDPVCRSVSRQGAETAVESAQEKTTTAQDMLAEEEVAARKAEIAAARAQQIENEIEEFTTLFPSICEQYRIVGKIGEGTFSSVYKAVDIDYMRYDNSSWDQARYENGDNTQHEEELLDSNGLKRKFSSVEKEKYVAIKRIYVTSSPERIANEISILHELSGSDSVVPLVTAVRHRDQVVVVLPYFRHDDFKTFYNKCTLVDIKYYFRSLFTALKHVHAINIIHRDIKPSNFLYDFKARKGILVDFGLAHKQDQPDSPHPHAESSRALRDSQKINRDNRARLTEKAPQEHGIVFEEGQVGYIKSDPRPAIKASRAGTRGFRAPEVLFRVVKQTTAIDIWAAGVILLCFLSGRFPFFCSMDDVQAILELACIYGIDEMAACAAIYDRTFETNVPSLKHQRNSFRKLCLRLNPEGMKAFKEEDERLTLEALDLLNKCMELDCTKRYTAEEALAHPFLS
ncbi:hypothetical protein BZG36_00929 [Bifiguratus adelaidae]|uniref:non-specific serine/threonine protein kinase n=1 Tax=Bifiguratus adelaidae TaxID=1938954 RepID=A0A261Y5I9_9FUNG|nr:hypothetical protein BZG36_00929 [Bifiguratus adelaidae]